MTVSTRLTLPADGRLRLATLGDAGLYLLAPGVEPERVLDVGKPLALLIYLACSRSREAARDHLTDLLWAHMERERAQSALRQAIWQIKTRIGDDFLTATRDRLQLAEAVEIDRDPFLAAAAAGEVDRVVELYRGDFVPGFATPGGAAFEDWANVERLALRRVFVRSAEEAIQSRLANGRSRDALTLARRARDADPLNQRAWRQVLECLVATGDAIGAHVEADTLSQMLEAEEIQPEPSTRTAIRDAQMRENGNGGQTKDTTNGLVAELIGREREFSAIMHAWDDINKERAPHFHIIAPAGLGKTRFLTDVRNRLRGRGAGTRAIYVRAGYGARDLAFAFASDVAARLAKLRGAGGISPQSAGTLVALNPALSSFFSATPDTAVGDEALRRRAIALRELIVAVADEGPLALLVDDLHWSDTLSFRALDLAITGIDKCRLLVVSAGRPTADDTRRPARATGIVLDPLTDDGVGALISSLGELPAEPWAERLPFALHEATGGSPLLVLETIQLLMENGSLVRDDHRWCVSDVHAVFHALDEGSALRRRVASLQPVESAMLLLLGVAGMPLPQRVLLEACEHAHAEVLPALAALEQRGLILLHDDILMVAHDEHATAALVAATPEAIQRASSAVGRALVTNAQDDAQRLCIAGSLIAKGDEDDDSLLESVFERFVRARRLAGDRRSDRDLARELLGTAATDQRERSLARSLPLLTRARVVSRGQITAMLAIASVLLFTTVVAWATLSRPTVPPDAVLTALRLSADRRWFEVFPIELSASEIAAARVINVPLAGRPRWRVKAMPRNGGWAPRPDRGGWTGGAVVNDSGIIDVFDFGLDGKTKRYTFAKKDDYLPSWAPDNSKFVFVTTRWSEGGTYDLAIYDTLTRETQHLTESAETDVTPRWSPDGSRIAFIRQHWPRAWFDVCLVDVDGTHSRCIRREQTGSIEMIGWIDAHHLAVRRNMNGAGALIVIDTRTGRETVDTQNGAAEFSPDGRFAVCPCPRPGQPPGTQIVYAVDHPNDFAVVRVIGDTGVVEIVWSPTTRSAPFIAHLNVVAGLGEPILGSTHQLRASATNSGGHAVDIGVVRWRSDDTTIATIDSTGLITPRRIGRVVVEASAGGWRRVRVPIDVQVASSHVLLDERWEGAIGPNWIGTGDPKPLLVSDANLGRALLNNGDGVFFSGAYTTRAFDTGGGLWMDVELSTPLTTTESQEISLTMPDMIDSVAWANWDRVTGDGPVGSSSPSWGVRFPYGSNAEHLGERFIVGSGDPPAFVNVPRDAHTGRPFRLVMQILPDGRCAVALNGRVAWQGSARFLRRRVHVRIEGNSVGTRVLVGHLRVGSGVAPGIDWSRAPLPP